MSNPRTEAPSGVGVLAILLSGGLVTALTLAPRWFVAPLHEAFMRLSDAVTPASVWIPWDDTERLLNTLLLMPLGATIALLLSRRLWPLAILAGFALSATVEYAQAWIPGRVPDPEDVFWNTLGAAIGVAIAVIARGLSQRRRATRT